MPQLDINAFLPIIYSLFLCYSFLFIVIYIFLFLPFINSTKIRVIWQRYRLVSLFLLNLYMKEISSYPYLQQVLKVLEDKSHY